MSGTSAGARRGWKTRKHQLPPVSAGRQKSPIRQAAGKRANETRRLHERNRAGATHISNYEQKLITRALVRGEITQAQADRYYKHNPAEYERQLRMNPVRHRKRGR
jgi:hypothetical protein